jgi:hypothetical protein
MHANSLPGALRMLNQSLFMRTLVGGFALIIVSSYTSNDLAQSGRKTRKSDPVQVSTPEPTPTPTVAREKPKPRYTFLVGLDRYDAFSNIPPYLYDGMLRSLVDRLSDSPAVHVAGTQTDMNRSDAIKKAKAEKEGLVVFVQLRFDSLRTTSQEGARLDDIVIDYSVFSPIAARVITSGRTYTSSQRNKGIIGPRTSSIYGDRYLNQAAQEAADKILGYFRSHGPPPPPPSKQP